MKKHKSVFSRPYMSCNATLEVTECCRTYDRPCAYDADHTTFDIAWIQGLRELKLPRTFFVFMENRLWQVLLKTLYFGANFRALVSVWKQLSPETFQSPQERLFFILGKGNSRVNLYKTARRNNFNPLFNASEFTMSWKTCFTELNIKPGKIYISELSRRRLLSLGRTVIFISHQE